MINIKEYTTVEELSFDDIISAAQSNLWFLERNQKLIPIQYRGDNISIDKALKKNKGNALDFIRALHLIGIIEPADYERLRNRIITTWL